MHGVDKAECIVEQAEYSSPENDTEHEDQSESET